MNAIFYHDICIEKDHYTKEISSTWLEINDAQVKKSDGLKVLNIFIYYFYSNKKLLLIIYIKQYIKYGNRYFIFNNI